MSRRCQADHPLKICFYHVSEYSCVSVIYDFFLVFGDGTTPKRVSIRLRDGHWPRQSAVKAEIRQSRT